MNYAIIIYVLGYIFNFSAGFMLLPGIVAIIYREQEGWWFLLSALIIGIIGLLLTRKKPENKNFYAREGMVVVALGWVGISILGAVPYVATGSIPNVVNALFESVSGFSTTGAKYSGGCGITASLCPVLAMFYQLDWRHGDSGIYHGGIALSRSK